MGTIKGGKILPKILTPRHDRVKAAIQTLPVAIWYSITLLMGLPSGGRSPENGEASKPFAALKLEQHARRVSASLISDASWSLR